MKTTFAIAVLISSLGGTAGYLTFKEKSGPGDPVRPVAPAYAADRVTANGIVEGARPEVALRPEIAGTIAAIPFRENQEVTKGSVLVQLHNETQKQQVALAEAELAVAQAALERLHNGERPEKLRALTAVESARRAVYRQARSDRERSQRLAAGRSISMQQRDADYFKMLRSEAELEEAAAERALAEAPPRFEDVAEAVARVKAAKARLEQGRAELAKTYLLAPSDGRILQVYAEPGELAGPTSARPLLLLADLSTLRVRACVEEVDAPRLKAGQKAVITVDGLPGKEFAGTVAVVLSRMGQRCPLTEAAREYRDIYYREVLISLDSWDSLLLNLRVQATICVDPCAEGQ